MSLQDPITLPSGLTLPNRLVKAAMAENLTPYHTPNAALLAPYHAWADGGWGMILTGNVQVSRTFLGAPSDVAIPAPSARAGVQEAWKHYADAIQATGTPGIVQINHPGRQSGLGSGTAGVFEKRVAPSAVPLKLGDGLFARAVAKLLFGTPRPLTLDEIHGPDGVIAQFVAAAIHARDAGFKGVELHAAHGYLLAQFLSPATNRRIDGYGGTAAKRARIVVEIIAAVRAATGKDFTIGIKLNSADASQAESADEIVEQVGLLVDAGIDFIEVSGGTYENPTMHNGSATPAPSATTGIKASTAKREAYFLTFTETLRAHFPNTVLMVTGGFRTRAGMQQAVASGATDLIGLARPAAIWAKLPKDIILNKDLKDEDATVQLEPISVPWLLRMIPLGLVGAGYSSMYYGNRLAALRV